LPSNFWKHMLDFPKCDLLIIMGTSLVVQPFAGLAGKVSSNCPRLLINRDKVGNPNMLGSFLTNILGLNPDFDTDGENLRDVWFEGDCDEGCLQLAKLIGWEDDLTVLINNSNNINNDDNKKEV
jgi:NAD+-dependent protein deacetylase sirtuin 2